MFSKKFMNRENLIEFNKIYKNNLRNEKKIIFFESKRFVTNFLKINRFKEIYKERNVNSIYFDDFKLTKLLDTVDGEKYRSKIRLRWYGKIKDIDKNPILEEKIKINNKNYKLHHQLKFKNIKEKIDVRKIQKDILSQLRENQSLNFKVKNLMPSSFVSYRRKYYLNNKLRITLDADLKYKNFFRDKYIKLNENFEKKKFLIVEFKFADESYEFVKLLSSQISNRFTKFSKYEFSLTN
tara:strand:+ start:2035 stop:2748 length:714 start_codon:yes stop_codon:yes gene_type:complete